VNTTGQDVLNVVFRHLNLVETAYFGLRYVDSAHQPVAHSLADLHFQICA
jgi:FERM N-terminal domain